MRLLAVKIGVGVPSEPFSGSVQSVFFNAAILTVANRLVTLAPTAAGGLPGAITLDVPSGFNFAGALTIGAAAVSRAGVLRFGGNAASIDLRGATAWRSRLCDLALDLAAPAVERAWITVAAVLLTDGRSAAIARLGHAAMNDLSQATRHFNLWEAEQAAERLVGLGAGGTPAGDDFLVGYLAGLFSSAGTDRTRTNFAVAFANTCRSLGKRTNDISRTYLEAAADGQVSERLADVAKSVVAGEAELRVAETVALAMAVGHSSGADGTLGLLQGLGSWGPASVLSRGRGLVDQLAQAAAAHIGERRRQ